MIRPRPGVVNEARAADHCTRPGAASSPRRTAIPVVESTGEVVHETRKMLFLRGTIFTGERTILRYSGVLKKVGPRKT